MLAVFAAVMLVLVVGLCLPALGGADTGYLEALTPFVMWAPALAIVVLHFAFGRPVELFAWAGLQRPGRGGAGSGRIVAVIGGLALLMAAVPAVVIAVSAAFGWAGLAPVQDAGALALWVLPLAALTMITTFGEEFAWRGYIASTLAPWGFWRATAAIGAFWSLWHLPLTAAYAVDGVATWAEVAVTSVNLLLASFVLAAARYLSGSVWPAVAGHAMLNTFLVFAYSNLMTDPAASGPGAYWAHHGLSWTVWSAAIVLAAALLYRSRGRQRRRTG